MPKSSKLMNKTELQGREALESSLSQIPIVGIGDVQWESPRGAGEAPDGPETGTFREWRKRCDQSS
jgi:hypothetical protein